MKTIEFIDRVMRSVFEIRWQRTVTHILSLLLLLSLILGCVFTQISYYMGLLAFSCAATLGMFVLYRIILFIINSIRNHK
jgi:hypothetical protein